MSVTKAAFQNQTIGMPPLTNSSVVSVSTTQGEVPLGTVVEFHDDHFGPGEAIYLKFPTSTAVDVGAVLVWDDDFLAAKVANTANLGRSVGFSANAVASSSSYQYGWAIISGVWPVFCGASVAADTAIGVTAAGKGGARASGKQILNCRSQAAATTTVAKTASTTSGSATLRVNGDTEGWFVGVELSGTGVASGAHITAINPDGTITMSANATATGLVTVTGTYNDGSAAYWNVCQFTRPCMQGSVPSAVTPSVITIPVTLATITAGDVVTNWTPGFAGEIVSWAAVVTTAATTISKAATLNLEIGTTNLTGGTIALTSANCTPLGNVIAASAITGNNTFSATDTLSVEGSSVTSFVEGAVALLITVKATVTE